MSDDASPATRARAADAVFSGGGIRGIAFAGAVKAAEEAGWSEWVELGGTSAGAIVALALALGYDADHLRRLFFSDLTSINDGARPLQIARNYRREGIASGAGLTRWLENLIKAAPAQANGPVWTFGDLESRTDRRLTVIGSDITRRRMVVLPDDAGHFLDRDGKPYTPASFPLLTAVRISAGVPMFFPPVKLRCVEIGDKLVNLVDGGLTSNFPVFLFDSESPERPTWAFRLIAPPRAQTSPVNLRRVFWPVTTTLDVLATSWEAVDESELRLFKGRTIVIQTPRVPLLDFDLPDQGKQQVYDSGYAAAREFFQGDLEPVNRFGKLPANVQM